MRDADEMVVLATEREARRRVARFVPRSAIVSSASSLRIDRCRHLFVLARATSMEETAPSIAALRDRLRVLFVELDVRPEWMPEMLYRSNFRALRSLIVHGQDDAVVGRVLGAWRMNAQERLIADAAVVGDALEVRSCAMERFEIPFAAIPALADLSVRERAGFEIDPDGGRIGWPSADVDLELGSLIRATSREARERADREVLLRDARLGEAIARVRKGLHLAQSEVAGLSERQVRRIEHGQARPRLSTLERLARAHGVTLSEYLDDVARVASSLSP